MARPPIVEVIDGVTWEFPRLQYKDLDLVAERLRARNKALLKQAAAANGIKDFQLPAMLLELDRQEFPLGHFQQMAWTPKGMRDILLVSWRKSGKPDKDLLTTLESTEFLSVFADIAYRCVTPPETNPPLAPKGEEAAPSAAEPTPSASNG